jgi:hypothetical protein
MWRAGMMKRDGSCSASDLINPVLCPAPYGLDVAPASNALVPLIL